jgi:hypothetical protein
MALRLVSKRNRRRQPRLPDGNRREPVLSCLPPDLAALVQMDAALYGCFASWVVADILANHYRVAHRSPFDDQRGNRR